MVKKFIGIFFGLSFLFLGNFVFSQSPPIISSIAPSAGQSPGLDITISGSGFNADMNLVEFEQGSNSLQTQSLFNSAAIVSATIPSSFSPGSVEIKVYNTATNLWSDLSFIYKILPIAQLTPIITSIEPSPVPWMISSITIRGKNLSSFPVKFLQNKQSFFGSVSSFTGSAIEVQFPPLLAIGPATAQVFAMTSSGQQLSSNVFPFTIVLPYPVIKSISPISGVSGEQITIVGVGFRPGSSENLVTFTQSGQTNPIAQQYAASPDGKTLSVTVPDVPESLLGQTVKIAVRTKLDNFKTVSNSADFTFVASPKITSVSPNSALPGVEITISGSNFKPGLNYNRVYFIDNNAGKSWEVGLSQVSSNQLKFKVPDLMPGQFQIRVGVWYVRWILSNPLPFQVLSAEKEKKIVIHSPKAGETLFAGQTYPIQWSSVGIDDFCLSLWKGNSRDYQLACNIKANSYSWTVRSSQEAGSDYSIQVCQDTLLSCGKEAKSGVFTINQITSALPPVVSIAGGPVISSIFPISGPSGATIKITGNNFGTPFANNEIYFYKGNNLAGFTLPSAGNSGELSFSVPPLAPDTYEIDVNSLAESKWQKSNRKTFTVVPSGALTTPVAAPSVAAPPVAAPSTSTTPVLKLQADQHFGYVDGLGVRLSALYDPDGSGSRTWQDITFLEETLWRSDNYDAVSLTNPGNEKTAVCKAEGQAQIYVVYAGKYWDKIDFTCRPKPAVPKTPLELCSERIEDLVTGSKYCSKEEPCSAYYYGYLLNQYIPNQIIPTCQIDFNNNQAFSQSDINKLQQAFAILAVATDETEMFGGQTTPTTPAGTGGTIGGGGGEAGWFPGVKCEKKATSTAKANELANPLCADNFEDLINSLIRFAFWLALVAAPLMMLIAGFYYITSAGDSGKIKTAKTMILYAAIGLAVILLARGLIAIIKGVLSG